jgi:serine/threonine protein kinase
VDGASVLIVTELMRGGDLSATLEHVKRVQGTTLLPTALRLRIAQGIAAAIDYMHINEIVHRDIKTENVLLDTDWRPVLADYGFARKVSVTRNMTIVGTDEFMAPEVIWGEPYDERADVFSFGVVLAELFTGLKAGVGGFMERSPRGKFHLDEDAIRAALREGIPDAPERLHDVVMNCLAYEPDDRISAPDALDSINESIEQFEADHPDFADAIAACPPPTSFHERASAASKAGLDVASSSASSS